MLGDAPAPLLESVNSAHPRVVQLEKPEKAMIDASWLVEADGGKEKHVEALDAEVLALCVTFTVVPIITK